MLKRSKKNLMAVVMVAGFMAMIPKMTAADVMINSEADSIESSEAAAIEDIDMTDEIQEDVENEEIIDNIAEPEITEDTYEITEIESESIESINEQEFDDGTLKYNIENGEATVIGIVNQDVTDIIIPSEINVYSVTSIGEKAFNNCKGLTSISIPDSVTDIDKGVFSYISDKGNIEVRSHTKITGDDINRIKRMLEDSSKDYHGEPSIKFDSEHCTISAN